MLSYTVCISTAVNYEQTDLTFTWKSWLKPCSWIVNVYIQLCHSVVEYSYEYFGPRQFQPMAVISSIKWIAQFIDPFMFTLVVE